MKPWVSVVIPVLNGEKYLAETLRSVLNQTFRSFEVIVIDDGSTDRTASVVREFGTAVSYDYQDHGGISAARNLGVNRAAGEFIAFLDDDDLAEPHRFAVQVKKFDENPSLDMALSHVLQFISPELDPSLFSELRIPEVPVPGCLPSTVMVRKSAFLKTGGFETRWRVAEFMNWYLRALECGLKIEMLPDVLVRRRIHKAHHVVLNREAVVPEYLRALKASIRRRTEGVPDAGADVLA